MARLHKVLICIIGLTLWTSSLSLAQDIRTWKDATGKFEVKATFVRVDGDKVVIAKEDGTNMSVPIAKLSPVDQGYVEGRKAMAPPASENPFEPVPNESSPAVGNDVPSDAAGSSVPGAPRVIKVDFNECPETSISKGEWNPSMTEQPAIPISLRTISLPGKPEFFEKLTKSTFNLTAKRAVLTHQFSWRGKPSTTRMELVDLESGKVLSNALGDGKWTALAIHDDGERVVVQNGDDSDQTMGQLGTVQLKGKKIVPLDLWIPYETMEEKPKEKVVRFAKFINNNRLLTLSQSGQVVIWDFATRKPIRRFKYHGACQPSLSHDRKHLAICGGDLLGIVNLEDENEAPSVKSAPGMNYWLSSAFSPSGKRFAATTMQKLMVWDVASGEVLFEGKIPGLQTNGSLFFPKEDFVMINGDKLIEFESGIKVWRYHGAVPASVHGQMVYIHCDQKGGKIMPLDVPHDAAKKLLAAAKAQSDLFILKKGAKVSFDLREVPQQYRAEVETSLSQNIEKMGFVKADNADVSLKAKVSGPTTEAVSYHFAGSFVVKEFKSNLSVQYNGKSVWATGANNIPGAVSGRGKDEIKKQMDKASQKPNLGFFGSARLPEFLQKPTGDGKPNSVDAQMLGSTKIGMNGLGE